MRQDVAVADASTSGGDSRGVHSFPLVLATFPLEARGGVLGAVTIAARPVLQAAPRPLAAPQPADASRSCGKGAGAGGGWAAAAGGCGAGAEPEGKAGAEACWRWSFPAADGLVALASALGPCLALARADADLTLDRKASCRERV